MYMPYLMTGYSIAVLLMIVACRVASRSLPGLVGIRLLAWALTSGLAGVLLLASRPIAPAWMAVLLAYQGIFGFSLLYYAAIAQCLFVRTRVVQWGVALLIAGLAADIWYAYVHPSLVARYLIGSLVQAVFAAAGARMLFRSLVASALAEFRRKSRRHVIGALAWLQVLATSQHLLRCVLTVLFPPAEPLHLDPIQAAYSYLNLTLSLASGVGLIGLAFLIHRNDLYSRANTDSLTGLLNRQAFDEILIRELRRLDSESLPVTVVMADIDFFKRVNDVQGHLAGDVVLRQVSRALSRTLRPSDALSRFGGEEFAMVLRETSLPRAVEVAERLRAAVAALSRLPGGIRVTISLGVAAGISAEPSQELIRRSDEALYRSKREGRNRVSVAAEIGGDSAPDPPAPRLALNGEAQRPA